MQFSRILRYQYIQISRFFRGRPYRFAFVAVGLIALFVLAISMREHREAIETADFGEMPDFESYEIVDEMKADFFDYLRPIVDYHNSIILQKRSQLDTLRQDLIDGRNLGEEDKEFLIQLAQEYDYELDQGWDIEIEDNINTHPISRVLRRLLIRVDEIPVDLALVQAAKESGWGRSRFAVEANNLFGHWCYSEGCGLVPTQRTEGATHEVRKFDSVADAIGAYMNNLNAFHSYETLRLIRAGLRSSGDPVTGMALADGLIYYSQRREAYVDEIKVMIEQYHEFQDERDLVES